MEDTNVMEMKQSFLLRSVAVIEVNKHYLMMQQVLDNHYYPVSTQVEAGEVSEQAVLRLLKETFGIQAQVERLLMIEESFNTYPQMHQTHHEVAFYYRIDLADHETALAEAIKKYNQQKNPERQFIWLDQSQIKANQIVPICYQQILLEPKEHVRIFRDRPQA
ncbi:NUDIX domain-containing protein [Vaginisenegalia massiliensis]|uniref:NUDIX domain-containing protein n=1 Tax=Vaginisenegalia massiliensis TaxID=2058294 RepID=UPI000F54299D|nr:NUDIX domain-containing protein [Vaginisenegalia massiliensis]